MIDLVVGPLLKAQTAVTALAGNRIYPEEVPQDVALPAITYKMIGMRRAPTLATAGMFRYRVQFDCWALTALAAVNVRNALMASLDGFQGVINGVSIQNMQGALVDDFFEHETLQFRRIVEFYIWTVS